MYHGEELDKKEPTPEFYKELLDRIIESQIYVDILGNDVCLDGWVENLTKEQIDYIGYTRQEWIDSGYY